MEIVQIIKEGKSQQTTVWFLNNITHTLTRALDCSLREGSEVGLKESDRRTFLSHATCRSGLNLREGHDYLIIGLFTDVWHAGSTSGRWAEQQHWTALCWSLYFSPSRSLSVMSIRWERTRGWSDGRPNQNVAPRCRLNVQSWRVLKQSWQRAAVRVEQCFTWESRKSYFL